MFGLKPTSEKKNWGPKQKFIGSPSLMSSLNRGRLTVETKIKTFSEYLNQNKKNFLGTKTKIP